MKLWEKNYVLTMILIILVLYGSMFFILSNSFRMNLERTCEQAVRRQQTIGYFVENLWNEDEEHKRVLLYGKAMEDQGIFFALYENQTALVDHMPFPIVNSTEQRLQIVKKGQNRYLYLSDSFSGQDGQEISLYYMEAMDDLYTAHWKQVVFVVFTGAWISVFLAGVLYLAMRKIYSPIHNISHELRTPLTSIQGYAQYILYGNLKPEDIQCAGSRINEEAKYMDELIERILVMEHIKDGEIQMETIELADIWKTVKTYYPSVTIEDDMQFVMGDRTLLLSLFLNLLSNSSRAGGRITITASGSQICIYNKDDRMSESMLEILNDNRPIPKDQIKGKGMGVSLCHEIVNLHHAALRYETSKNGGIKVTVSLNNNL